MKKNKWHPLARVLVIIFMITLFFNVVSLGYEVRRDLSYKDRCYGLSVMNDYFDNGNYYDVYLCTIRNQFTDEKPDIDVSDFEAFGRFYDAYCLAKIADDKQIYLSRMQTEKEKVTLKKILTVMEDFERELKEQN